MKWETRFTDYANWAEPNHTLKDGTFKRHRAEEVADFENGINALEVFEVPEGETGNITVTYMVGRKEIRTHTWHYYIISNIISKKTKQKNFRLQQLQLINYVLVQCSNLISLQMVQHLAIKD